MQDDHASIDHVDLQLLRYFNVLMQERSVSKAAVRLDVTQSAVSHALGRLRILFQDSLLERAKGEMRPTPRALKLEPIVDVILRDIEKLVAPWQVFDPATSKAKFVMTSTLSFDYLVMPYVVERMRREAPSMTLEAWLPNSRMGDDWIENGQVDFRLGWVPDPAPELRLQTLYVDRLVCIARSGHPDVDGRISVDRYLELSHVRSGNARRTNTFIDNAVAALGATLNIPFIAHSPQAVMQSVAQTDLIAVLPLRIARESASRLNFQIVEIPFELPEMRVALYWNERTHDQAAHRWLRRLIAEVAREKAI